MSTNDPNLDRDFNFNISLGGITAPTGQGNMHVPEGYYTAVVSDMYVNHDRNSNRVIIKLKIQIKIWVIELHALLQHLELLRANNNFNKAVKEFARFLLHIFFNFKS